MRKVTFVFAIVFLVIGSLSGCTSERTTRRLNKSCIECGQPASFYMGGATVNGVWVQRYYCDACYSKVSKNTGEYDSSRYRDTDKPFWE